MKRVILPPRRAAPPSPPNCEPGWKFFVRRRPMLLAADGVDSRFHFTNWDGNNDGFLTLEEFQLGQKNRSGLEATFKSYDQNADGKLSREEYVDPRAK